MSVLKTQRWLRVRKRQLAREPLCSECGKPATDVDHIVPRARGGAPFDVSNLQSLCASCHSIKTATYDKVGKDWMARGCDADGYPIDPEHPWNEGEGAVIHGEKMREDRLVGSRTQFFSPKGAK